MLLLVFEGAPLVQLSGVVTQLWRKGLFTAGLLLERVTGAAGWGVWPWPRIV